jgi:hypothetical protein
VGLCSEGCLGSGHCAETNPEGRLKAGLACCSAFAVAGDLGLRLDANGLGGPTMQPRRESAPLWVWITVGLMALGTLAYFGAVFLAEYMMPGL